MSEPRPIGRSRAVVVLERLLLAIGVICLGYYGYATVEARLYQAWENRHLDEILAGVPHDARAVDAADAEPIVSAPRPAPAPGSILGRLEIPRLGVSTIVRAGSDARTLNLAVGHIAGTAMPGETGNVGLAGHRDTFFRRLESIRSDDEIRFVTPDGIHVYRVQRTDVVEPADVWVLDSTGEPVLTLVTCYPFTYVGPAPERFIVRALLDPSSS
jgi:sortase A